MARFLYAAVSSLLLLADPSSSANLRSIVEHGRRLSYELIAYYEPKTQVTDHVSFFFCESFFGKMYSVSPNKYLFASF